MNILHVIPAVAMRYGGPSVAVRGMAAAQSRRGHRVVVATTDADGAARLDVPVGEPVSTDGYTIHHFARALPGEWKYSRQLSRWLDDRVAQFDVVHVHALFCHANAAAARAAWRHGVPYVMRPLGTLGGWSLAQRRWKKAPYYLAVERTNLRRAAAIHATSQAEAAEVAALGFGDRVHVVELGLDVNVVAGRAPLDAAAPLRVIFLGRLHPKKNLPLLLGGLRRAVAAGADVTLEVVGDGEPAYVGELRARARELGIADRVRFVGPLGGVDKWSAFARSDVFALPSNHENFGIAVAEAMVAGCAVLVSDQVAIAADVAASGGGMIVDRDEQAIARSLSEMAQDRAKARTMGARASAFAAERYSWARTAERLDELYAAITARGAEEAA